MSSYVGSILLTETATSSFICEDNTLCLAGNSLMTFLWQKKGTTCVAPFIHKKEN